MDEEQQTHLEQQLITRTLEENYMPYAMSVIISRAIPEIDGFKPSHRKLLYTMYKMGLLNGARTKSANVVGQTMKLNPHGDAAIYETMVRLTEGNMALLHPLVDSKGNFGRQYSRDTAYAASRYTEVRLSSICSQIFGDIDKNTVEFVPNYDGTIPEPVLLPVAFPNVLVNPNQGIAVGMASNIASFNLREICAATTAFMQDPDVDLTTILHGPDFSTGANLIYDETLLRQVYETGRGSLRVRATYRYDKKNNLIEITQIPYTTTTEAIIDKLADLIKSGRVREINDVRDETDKLGLKIAIELKRGVDPDKLMTRLFRMTPLEDSFGCNFNLLIDGEPRVLGVKQILKEWVRFRTGCLRRSYEYDIEKKEARLHLLRGLEKIVLDIDRAIHIVRNTPEDAMVVPNLMEGFGIDELQAEFVAEIKLRNLNREYILKRTAEIEKLEEEISKLRRLAGSDKLIHREISKQLDEIAKKYGADRRTQCIAPDAAAAEPEESYIDDYNLKIFLTRDNYFKKISLTSLRGSSEQKLKEGDRLICEAEATNKMDILFFSDRQNVYKMRLYEMNDAKAGVLGDYLPNVLSMEEGESIVFATPAYDYNGFMLFAFENGKVAKIEMKSYETKTNRKRLTGGYSGASRLVGARYCAEETQIALFSTIDKCVVFETKAIAAKTSRSSQGIQVLTLRRKSSLKSMALPADSLVTDASAYAAKSIPSAGYYLKDEDTGKVQLSLFE